MESLCRLWVESSAFPARKQQIADFGKSSQNPSTILALSCHYLEAEVGIELGNLVVPILTNSKQINRLRSFPSEIRVPEGFEKIKNYPANSLSKFSHYSSSIILLELLLEVVPVSSKFLRVTDIIPVPKGAVPDNRIVLVQRRTRKPRFLDANQPSLRARQ